MQICPVGALTTRPTASVPARSTSLRHRASCEHCAGGCAAHRPAAQQGVAPPRRRRPGRQRGVELRQGPVGTSPTRQRPDRLTTPRLVRDSSGTCSPPWLSRRWPSPPGLRRYPRRVLVGGGHRRGRLRLRQVRTGRPGHQRRRLPCPCLQRRGDGIPGPPGRRRRDAGGLRRPRARTRRPPGRTRAGGRIADVFLRLRKAVRAGTTKVHSIAPRSHPRG